MRENRTARGAPYERCATLNPRPRGQAHDARVMKRVAGDQSQRRWIGKLQNNVLLQAENSTDWVFRTVSSGTRAAAARPPLVDRQVLAEEQISIGSGLANTGIVMRSQDLLGALQGAETVDLIQAP